MYAFQETDVKNENYSYKWAYFQHKKQQQMAQRLQSEFI